MNVLNNTILSRRVIRMQNNKSCIKSIWLNIIDNPTTISRNSKAFVDSQQLPNMSVELPSISLRLALNNTTWEVPNHTTYPSCSHQFSTSGCHIRIQLKTVPGRPNLMIEERNKEEGLRLCWDELSWPEIRLGPVWLSFLKSILNFLRS